MHENNAKVFLLTNSDFTYCDVSKFLQNFNLNIFQNIVFMYFKKVMGYLLNDDEKQINWKSYFDYIVVDARKPLFFAEGTSLKEIDSVL